MKIKTTCVRCGKPLSGASVYCSSCDGAELKASEPLQRPAARPRKTGLLLLFLVCGVVAFALLRPAEEAWEPGRVLQSEERADNGATAPAVTLEDRSPAPLASAPADKPEAPEVAAEQAPQTPAAQADFQAPAAPPAETQPTGAGSWGTPPPAPEAGAGEQAAPEGATSLAPSDTPSGAGDAPQEQAAAQNGNPAASTGAAIAPAPEAPAEVPPAVLENLALVWLYYAKEPGKDAAAKALLEKHGYTSVLAKGEWPTRYAVNYLFYRDKDAVGVRELSAVLGDLEFNALYHLDEATSTRLRGYFAENPELQFVLILQ